MIESSKSLVVKIEESFQSALGEYVISTIKDFCSSLSVHLDLVGRENGIFSKMEVEILPENRQCPGLRRGCFAHLREEDVGSVVVYVDPVDPLHEIMDIIAHEFIHAKQWLDGRLSLALALTQEDVVDWVWVWCGQAFGVSRTDQEYLDSPWEIEAFGGSDVLVQDYFGNLT